MEGFKAEENKTFTLSVVEELYRKSLNRIGAENWKKCFQHTQRIEKEMQDLDEAVENIINSGADSRIII